METLRIDLPPAIYQQLRQRAHREGKPPELVSREILEGALRDTAPAAASTREILQAAGLLRPLGPLLERKIIPGVTLEEVEDALDRAGGPTLSEIILAQRGSKE